MIRLESVTLTYPDGDGRLTALDRVTLAVQPGTVTGITGPSGSGKSSLLAVAASLIRPDSGRVLIDGDDTTRLSRDESTEVRRRRIGLVFQQSNLIPSLTAREQLLVMNELGARRGRTRGAAAERADELLATVGLGDQRARRPHELSGGQRQRVNIARALMRAPGVLLVDEPTSALDSERGASIIELIVRVTSLMSTSTLLVTHDHSHLPAFHEVVELIDGRRTVEPRPRQGDAVRREVGAEASCGG